MPRTTLQIPEAVDVELDHLDLTVEGPEGSVTRRLWYPDVTVAVEDSEASDDASDASGDEPRADTVVIESDEDDAKTRATIGTFESHVENMIHGVLVGWEYEMEVLYSHFPMQVSVEDENVTIENFLGERAPRRTPIHGNTQVNVDGESINLSGPDIEAVGQTAADIEQLTRINDKDVRVFQDGVYITSKPSRGDA